MKEYVVQSGTLKITIVADCPRDAAVEALACWQGQTQQEPSPPVRPGGIQPELVVRRRDNRSRRYFSAIRLLAQLRGESLIATWKQLLQRQLASPN